jgi:hypothetical protein
MAFFVPLASFELVSKKGIWDQATISLPGQRALREDAAWKFRW